MRKVNYCTTLLMLLAGILIYKRANSQSIRGDTIFLELNKVVRAKFITPPSKFELLPTGSGQENVYTVDIMGDNSISIHALKKGENQDLEVTEKDRKHLFILSYKEGSTARTEDFSNKRKVSQRAAEVKKNVNKALNEADSLYDQAKNNKADPALLKRAETGYQRLARVVEGNDVEYVKSRLEEIRKQSQDFNNMKYGEAIKGAQDNYSTKKFSDARKAYLRALEYNPGDAQALKGINLTDSVWAKEYVDKGDEANKIRRWVDAKTYYQEARNIKPDYPQLQDKFNQVKKLADPQIYTAERDKGDLAMKAYDLEDARKAYDSAWSVKPDDRYIKNQLKALIVEVEKVEQEQQKDAEYQGILAKAKTLADKASSVQEYDLAIKEYEQAKDLIPDRKFPWKKIAELTKKKRSARPNQ